MLRLINKRGIVLFLTIFIMLGFATMAYLCMYLLTMESQDYMNALYSLRAFCLAETARYFAKEFYLCWAGDFTDSNQFMLDSNNPIYPSTPLDPTNLPHWHLNGGTFTIRFESDSAATNPRKVGFGTYTGSIPGPGSATTTIRRIRQRIDALGEDAWQLRATPVKLQNFGLSLGSASHPLTQTFNDVSPAVPPNPPNFVNINSPIGIEGDFVINRGNINSSGNNRILATAVTYGEESTIVNHGIITLGNNAPPSTIDTYVYADVYYNESEGGGLSPPGTDVTGSYPFIGDSGFLNIQHLVWINTTYFDNLLAHVFPYSGTLYIDDDYPLLRGKYLYIDKNVEIGKNNSNTVLSSGPAGIITTGNITVYPHVQITDRYELISGGTITIYGNPLGDFTRVGTNVGCLLYAKNGIILQKYVMGSGPSVRGVLINTSQPITIGTGSLINGLVIAKGTSGIVQGEPAYLSQIGQITGAVYAEGGIGFVSGNTALLERATITHDIGRLPFCVRGMWNFRDIWQEAIE